MLGNIRTKYPIVAHRANSFLFTVKENGEHRKLFKIDFGADGSVYVIFPYFEDTRGILSKLPLRPNTTYPADLSLKEGGRATTNNIKYSHHPDGEAHFSQHGKIKTEIRKKSVPLDEIEGHLFTVQLQGLEKFSLAEKKKDFPRVNAARTVLNIGIPHGLGMNALKFVGTWHNAKRLSSCVPSGPIIGMTKEDGTIVMGYMISGIGNRYADKVLHLSAEITPILDKSKEPCLIFLGGFDRESVVFDHAEPSSMLCFSYPIKDITSLEKDIGTVDFNPASL